MRELNALVDAESAASAQEDKQLREWWLSLNDALDDAQRRQVATLLGEQLLRVVPEGRPGGERGGDRGEKGGERGGRGMGGHGRGGMGGPVESVSAAEKTRTSRPVARHFVAFLTNLLPCHVS